MYSMGIGTNFDCAIIPGARNPLSMSKLGMFSRFCGRSAGLIATVSTGTIEMDQTVCSKCL